MIGLIADIHLDNFKAFGGAPDEYGLNYRGQLCLASLDRALKLVAGAGCSHVIVAGDLFHRNRPDPPLMAEAIRLLLDARDKGGVEPVLLVGNHDLIGSGWSTDHALRPLAEAGLWVVHEPTRKKLNGCKFTFVPFAPGSAGEQLRKVQAELSGDVLVGHYGLMLAERPPGWQKESPDYFVPGELDTGRESWRYVFMGHFHVGARRWKDGHKGLASIGCLNPIGFGDALLGGSVLLFDPEAGAVVRQRVPGPRFVLLKGEEDVEAVRKFNEQGCEVFVRTEKPGLTLPPGVAFVGFEALPEPDGELPLRPQSTSVDVPDAIVRWLQERLKEDEGLRQGATERALDVWAKSATP